MRSLVSAVLVRITWALTIAALLALSISAGLFDLSRPGEAATAALASPAGQRLATDFIADQLLVAVPGLSEQKAHDLAAKVAADPGTLVALKQANLTSATAPQDRAALLEVVASQLKESNPKVAAATQKYAGQVQAAAASDQADPDGGALSEPASPIGGILERVQQFTGGATNVSAAMSDLKEQLAHIARVLAGLAALTALGALVFAPSRARVVRAFGWMFISISLIPAAIGWIVPDLVLARMSSDWAQALAVGLRVGGSRLIGLFVGLLCAGVVLLVLGAFGTRLGPLLSPTRTAGQPKPEPPSSPFPPAGRPQEAERQPGAGYAFPGEPTITRPMAATHPGGPGPGYRPYGEQPADQEPYGPPGDDNDRWR